MEMLKLESPGLMRNDAIKQSHDHSSRRQLSVVLHSTTSSSSQHLLFTATIMELKESMKEEVKDNSDIKIYMNGSGFKGIVGHCSPLQKGG